MELGESPGLPIRAKPAAGKAVSQPRKRSRPRVFRVTGLPLKDETEVEKALQQVIRENMVDDEEERIQILIQCVLSCDSETLNALVQFKGGSPVFLQEIEDDPLESYQLEMGDDDISFDQHFHGFTQLYPVKTPISLDIIAITGLAGNAYGSWRGKGNLGRMWLRDFLSKDFPHCRTMIYGYNSKLTEDGLDTILDYGRGFLEGLKSIRKTEESRKRPIVFIAHSFGGILLANALLSAHHTDERDHPTIATLNRSTYGIFFFGVPQRGLIIEDLLNMLDSRTSRRDLVENIGKKSDLLLSQLDQLRNIARDYRIATFYELKPTRCVRWDPSFNKWVRTGEYVTKVDGTSAVLGFPDSMEIKVGVDADHSNMVKFDSRNDAACKSVLGYLKEFESEAGRKISERYVNTTSSKKRQPSSTVPFPRDSAFVRRHDQEGRDVLETISAWFSRADTHIRGSIVGLGGVGKSQLAIEYSYHFREQHTESWVFWVSCRNNEAFEQSYQSTARLLEIPGFDDTQRSPLTNFSEWLTDINNGHWLMILDNADILEMFRPAKMPGSATETAFTLSRYIPQVSHGAVLITSRNRNVASELTNRGHIIGIGPMQEKEAIELLCARLPNKPAEESAQQLVQQLDFIPLAITQSAAFIDVNFGRMTVERYLSLYKQEENQSRLLTTENGDMRRDPGIPNSVINTWQLSFNHINDTTPKASDLLSLMAVLDRQDIPEFLLLEWFEKELEFEVAIGELLKFSLVVSQPGNDKYEMHRLVQLATREWLRLNNKLGTWQIEATLIMSRTFPLGIFENLARCQALLTHVIIILNYEVQTRNAMLAQAELLSNLAEFNYTRGHYKDAENLARISLNIRQQFLPEEHEHILYSNTTLSNALEAQGHYKDSGKLDLQLLEIRKRVLGPEHPDTLTSMANLAVTYKGQDRLQEVESLEVEALDIRKRVLGPEHPDTLTSMANLAVTYKGQNRLQEANMLEVEALDIRKRVLGLEHPDTLTSMANLAITYKDQDHLQEAEKLGVEALGIRKRVLGLEHPDTLTSMTNLAVTYKGQNRLQEAEKLEVEALGIRKRMLGPEHPRTLASMAGLAVTYWSQGRLQEAEKLGVEVLDIRKRVLGSEHLDTLTNMANLAMTYWSQDRLQESEKLGVEVLDIRKRVLGLEHPDTLTSMGNLALTYKGRNRLQEAEKLEVEALDIRRRVLGSEHPDTLISMANLAVTYWDQGLLQEAEKLEVEVLDIRKKVLGPKHLDTLTSMVNLAVSYKGRGRLQEAESLEVEVLDIRRRVLGSEHPDTLLIMVNLAITYKGHDRLEEAERLEVEVLDVRKRVLGPEHSKTLNSMNNLARTWRSQGRNSEAEDLMTSCVALRRMILGPGHPDTRDSIQSLDSWKS